MTTERTYTFDTDVPSEIGRLKASGDATAPSDVADSASEVDANAERSVPEPSDAAQSSVGAFDATDVGRIAADDEGSQQDEAESARDADSSPDIATESTGSGSETSENGASTEADADAPEGEARATPVAYARREKTTIVIPSDLDLRIGIIARCERRTRAVVIEEAFRIFLSAAPSEPRPYLPDPGEPSAVRITATVSSALVTGLKARAASEARTYPALATRALYDYADASPFDIGPKPREGGWRRWRTAPPTATG